MYIPENNQSERLPSVEEKLSQMAQEMKTGKKPNKKAENYDNEDQSSISENPVKVKEREPQVSTKDDSQSFKPQEEKPAPLQLVPEPKNPKIENIPDFNYSGNDLIFIRKKMELRDSFRKEMFELKMKNERRFLSLVQKMGNQLTFSSEQIKMKLSKTKEKINESEREEEKKEFLMEWLCVLEV